MKILFATHPYPNYVPDLLLHGLRKLMGPEVVDFPRKDCLYQGVLGLGVCPEDQLCPQWFPDDDGLVDRQDVWHKARRGYFDMVVIDIRALQHAAGNLVGCSSPVAIIDGEDRPRRIQPGPYVVFRRETDGTDASIPLPMALPEEIFNWIVRYDQVPKKHSIGFLGGCHNGERRRIVAKLLHWYPDALFETTDLPLDDCPRPQGRKSRDSYYRLLQSCRFVLTLPGAGFDTFRFWENCACNSLHLCQAMPVRIPFDFQDQVNLIRFNSPDDLRFKIDTVVSAGDTQQIVAMGRYHLINHHLTTHRAEYFIQKMAQAYGMDTVSTSLTDLHPNNAGLKPIQATKAGSESKSALDNNSHLVFAGRSETDDAISRGDDSGPIQKIYLGMYGSPNSGWGVCSHHFEKQLSELIDLHILKSEDDTSANAMLDGIFFQAVNSAEFVPLFARARGTKNIGYTFFETELTPKSVENANQFDLMLAGSTWCRERMREKGIENCDVLLQGIDPGVFYPIHDRKEDDRFIIFSGGKFELRKSQDLVLRALKIFQDRHADVWLINCWANVWEQSIRMMESSNYIHFEFHSDRTWKENMMRTYHRNGLDPGRIITCDPIPNDQLRQLYARTDIGLFPNRCEGGTNLVMMEYMACAKPVIASSTSGHKDILTPDNALGLNALRDLNVVGPSGEHVGRWQEPLLDEILAQLEFAYDHRPVIKGIGRRAGEDMKCFTWEKSARNLIKFAANQC